MNQEDSKLCLMVVDDEADNLDLLYRTFRREFKVFKAESAAIALQLLKQHGEMAIIISDQRMPKMNGTEFLSLAAQQFPDTIRILLTGYTDVEDLVEAINAGKVFKYITKPWTPAQMQTVVQQAAETYRVLKARTNDLRRALRRESIFNAVTTAIRESLDYRSMLQTIVEKLGQTFQADGCVLCPLEQVNTGTPTPQPLMEDSFSFWSTAWQQGVGEATLAEYLPLRAGCDLGDRFYECRSLQLFPADSLPYSKLLVPLTCQQETLAILALYRRASEPIWSAEDVQLIGEVSEQAAIAISQARLYQRIQQQTEQMRAELAVARQIQTNLLRQELPQLENARVQACCCPAREVGGDFFEVYVHPQGDIWLGVGDVSGKGVPAALFMASAISVLRRELSQEYPPNPDQVMRNLNSTLMDDLVSNNCFITLVLARYQPQTRELVYANAGHVYPMVWSQVPATVPSSQGVLAEPTYLETRGVPLGILPVWKARAGKMTLRPKDILLLTSDGVTEATLTTGNDPGVMLRQQGLWQLVSRQQESFCLSNLLAHIQERCDGQEDDQTLLSLEVL